MNTPNHVRRHYQEPILFELEYRASKCQRYGVEAVDEFCKLARKAYQNRYRDEMLAECLPLLETARREVRAAVERTEPKSRKAAEGFYADMERVCYIASSYDEDDAFQHEPEFLLLVAQIERANTPQEEYSPDDPAGMVWALREAIAELCRAATEEVDFPDLLVAPEGHNRVMLILGQNVTFAIAAVKRLVFLNVDRWICTRLGTNPDQWTTRLSHLLRRLALALCHFWTEKQERSKRVHAICRKLCRMNDELGDLRFDSLFPEVAEMFPGTADKAGLRVRADIDANAVWLDENPERVPKFSAVYLQALIESGEKPISGTEISERYPEFPADKVTRYRERLPKGIQELIETSQGSGSCLKPEAWQKSQS